MKSSDKPQISKKWWDSEKPSDIKGADLEKALAIAEKALADAHRHADEKAIEAGRDALDDLESAVDKTIKKECDKKKHKDLITVLEKFGDLIKHEIRQLDDAASGLQKGSESGDGDGGEEEDESDDKLFDKDRLYKLIKLLRAGNKEMNFGFGLNPHAAESSQLILKRKGKPDFLFKALKRKGYSNHCLTYGTALADPEDGKTLLFRLDASASEPPQIVKLGRRFLRGDKDLKFRKLKVILAGGNTLVDDEPDDENEAPSSGQSISPEEMEKIRQELASMSKRLDDLITQHRVSA